MATGDVKGNLERMRVQLRSIAYPHAIDIQGAKNGLPAVILPLLHYALLGYSRHVARYIFVNGYELYAKSDLRFVECVMKLLRKEFDYRCPLTVAQIFAKGFAEKKFLFVHDVIQMCKRKHNELLRLIRQTDKRKRDQFQPKPSARCLQMGAIHNHHLGSKFGHRCEPHLPSTTLCKESCCTCQATFGVPARESNGLAGLFADSKSPTLSPRASLEGRSGDGSRAIMNVSPTRTDMKPTEPLNKSCRSRSPSPEKGCCNNIGVSTDGTSPDKVTQASSDHTLFTKREACMAERSGSRSVSPNTQHSPTHQACVGLQEVCQKKSGCAKSVIASPLLARSGRRSSIMDLCPNYKNMKHCPEEMWQKIMDLAEKVETCFNSLDQKIGACFNSLDNKMELRFNHVNAGVTQTKDTIQERLILLEARVKCLEATLTYQTHSPPLLNSPHQARMEVPYNDQHAIRDITNLFNCNNSVPQYTRTNLAYVHQGETDQASSMQQHQKITNFGGLHKANTQEFIAGVKARFHQTKELLNGNDSPNHIGGGFHAHKVCTGTRINSYT
ncbi:unnamed protein product [Sphagnum tenellum]